MPPRRRRIRGGEWAPRGSSAGGTWRGSGTRTRSPRRYPPPKLNSRCLAGEYTHTHTHTHTPPARAHTHTHTHTVLLLETLKLVFRVRVLTSCGGRPSPVGLCSGERAGCFSRGLGAFLRVSCLLSGGSWMIIYLNVGVWIEIPLFHVLICVYVSVIVSWVDPLLLFLISIPHLGIHAPFSCLVMIVIFLKTHTNTHTHSNRPFICGWHWGCAPHSLWIHWMWTVTISPLSNWRQEIKQDQKPPFGRAPRVSTSCFCSLWTPLSLTSLSE